MQTTTAEKSAHLLEIALEHCKGTLCPEGMAYQVIQRLEIPVSEIQKVDLGPMKVIHLDPRKKYEQQRLVAAQKNLRRQIVKIGKDLSILEIGKPIPSEDEYYARRISEFDGTIFADTLRDRTLKMKDVLKMSPLLHLIKARL